MATSIYILFQTFVKWKPILLHGIAVDPVGCPKISVASMMRGLYSL